MFNQKVAPILIYDGHCQFCVAAVQKLKIMDLFATLQCVDLHDADLGALHPSLSKEKAMSQLHLVEEGGGLCGGFDIFRRICFTMPMLYPVIPIIYCPGMGIVGPWVYRFVAKNRYFFHFSKACQNNTCFR